MLLLKSPQIEVTEYGQIADKYILENPAQWHYDELYWDE